MRFSSLLCLLVASRASATHRDMPSRPGMPGQMLRLRGGHGLEVGAPLEDVGAPGYDSEPFEEVAPLGGRPVLEEMTVPGTHDNISHAIASVVDPRQTIRTRSGDHRWIGMLATEITLNSTIDVRGEGKARLIGRWLLSSAPPLDVSSRGSFVGVTCAYATSNYSQVVDVPHALFAIMGGPWLFGNCELRAASADVLACCSVACVNLSSCRVGGMGQHNVSNGTMLAVGGVSPAALQQAPS